VEFGYLAEQVLLVDAVAVLVQPRQLVLEEAAHLEYAQHLLALVLQREIVRQELDLVGVWVLSNDVKVEEIQELREKPVLDLINIDLINLPAFSFLFYYPIFLRFPRLLHFLSSFFFVVFTFGVSLKFVIVVKTLVVSVGLHHSGLTAVAAAGLQGPVRDVRDRPYQPLVIDYLLILLPFKPEQREYFLVVKLLEPE